MKRPFLSHFTPSLMSHEALEEIFVQREVLASRLVEHIRDSALGSSKHYALLVGPRGIGKTHLVALAYHRVKAMEDVRERLLIAWMREEEWGVDSFLDLLLRIFRALESEHAGLVPPDRVEALFEKPSREAEEEAGRLLREIIGERTLLLLVENLDDLFAGLGDGGQKRLRAWLQENPVATILATSQGLFNGVSRQDSPFYGFFRIHHLKPLGAEDVTLLLLNIARWKGDRALASFIQSATGRARIRAVHHLAGGNHRVYVIFSQFLDRDSLDALVPPFMSMLDELTPYYQARMAWLSPQQRKIAEYLCDRRGTAPVKDIAKHGFMSQQTASNQLKKLSEMGYVVSHPVGRDSLYELREPLMRLCIEVKKNRGEPISLLVDFLRLWYLPNEMQQMLLMLRPDAEVERKYLLHALELSEREDEDLRVKACKKDFTNYLEQNDPTRALEVAEELVAIRGGPVDWYSQWLCLHQLKRHEEALVAIEKAAELEPENTRVLYVHGVQLRSVDRPAEALVLFDQIIEFEPDRAEAWAERGAALNDLGRFEEGLASCERAFSLNPNDSRTWRHQAVALSRLRLDQEALKFFEKVLAAAPEDDWAWNGKAQCLIVLGRWEEALAACDKAIEFNPGEVSMWLRRGQCQMNLDLLEEALASSQRAITMEPTGVSGWALHAMILDSLDRTEEALKSFLKALELSPEDAFVTGWCGETLRRLHRYDEALQVLDKAVKMGPQPPTIWTSRAVCLFGVGSRHQGFQALDDALGRFAEDDEPSASQTWAILIASGQDAEDPSEAQQNCGEIAALYEKHGVLTVLGQALLQGINVFTSADLDGSTIQVWQDMWREAARDRAELQLPLRLLDAAVRFRETRDPRVLLELPSEERALLQELMHEEPSEENAA